MCKSSHSAQNPYASLKRIFDLGVEGRALLVSYCSYSFQEYYKVEKAGTWNYYV